MVRYRPGVLLIRLSLDMDQNVSHFGRNSVRRYRGTLDTGAAVLTLLAARRGSKSYESMSYPGPASLYTQMPITYWSVNEQQVGGCSTLGAILVR